MKDFTQVQERVEAGSLETSYKKDELVAIAEALNIEDTTGTKADIAGRITEVANTQGLPTPETIAKEAKKAALRGESTVDSPVRIGWAIADRMFLEAHEKGEDPPRRKDVVEAIRNAGVAFYTARTQYQAWFEYTNGGESLISQREQDPGDLPRGLGVELGLEQPEPEEEATAEA